VVDELIQDADDGMKRAVEAFQRDLSKVRTGRANLSLLDGIRVDYYGTPTPLNQVATLNVADAKLITIKPWEKNMLAVIEKSIRASDLGLNPVTDSEMIRLPIPPLTQERRKELVKVIKKMTEDARVAIRGARRDANDMLKEMLKDKDISEDDSKNGQKRIQDLTDKFIKQVDDVGANKEKEIMEL
jgi:ribosome recycling factor